MVPFVRTTQHLPAVLAWATAYRNAATFTVGLLENGCIARVGFGWRLAALVCGLECPAAQLLSAVDVSTQPHCLVVAGAAWNIHCNQLHQYKGASCCILASWLYWINLGHLVWLTGAQ